MKRAYMPNSLFRIQPTKDDQFSADPHVPLGEDYIVYAVSFFLNSDVPEIMQHVSLSKALINQDGSKVNDIPFLCGAYTTTPEDFVFLHTDTIMELVRRGNNLYVTEMAKRLEHVQQPVLDDTPKEGPK